MLRPTPEHAKRDPLGHFGQLSVLASVLLALNPGLAGKAGLVPRPGLPGLLAAIRVGG